MEHTQTMCSLRELIATTESHLSKLKYQPGSIKVYKLIWEKLIKFAENERCEKYSVDLGERFLIATYGFSLLGGVKKTDLIKCRAIRMLSDMQNLGLVNRRVVRIKDSFHDSFADVFEKYL